MVLRNAPQGALRNKGHSLTKSSCELITLQAQGKDIPVEKQLALNKKIDDFMLTEFSKFSTVDKSQHQVISETIAQFLAGVETAYNEYPLEQTFKKYNTTKELAEKIRLSIKLSTEMVTSTKNVLIKGDISKFNNLGRSLQQYGEAGANIG